MPLTDQGVSTDRFMMIPRSLIFLFKDGEVLLLKGAPNKRIWANKYNGIGGHVEAGENLLAAARRELFEETGLIDKSLFLAGIVTIDTNQPTGITLYVWKGSEPEGDQSDSEEGLLEWIPVNELEGFELVEDLPTIIPLAMDKQAGDQPFIAHYHFESDIMKIGIIRD